jgi:O-antigen ligase
MQLIIYSALVITISTTPWVNSDALIIPKIIILSCIAAYIFPDLIRNHKLLVKNKILRLQIVLSSLFILQMIMVMVISDAPFEQEFYGKTGRGLGFLTYFSLFIIMVFVSIKIRIIELSKIAFGLMVSCCLSSLYSMAQFYGFDFFDWRTQTNGIIGTIGNPNFQSSFVAIAFLPSIVFIWSKQYRIFLTTIVFGILLFTLYITQSTQGYIALASSMIVFLLIHLWYSQQKILFKVLTVSSFFMAIVAISGMLNRGPLSYYLYKVSVQSRGEMWQTASAIIRDNPMFGVGLDSLGDYSLKYRSAKTASGIDEYIDNGHNFILQFAATGGIGLAVLYIGITSLALYSFIKLQRKIGKFDKFLAAIFAGWVSFQLQSLISPAAIPTLIWNFIFCGALIGLSAEINLDANAPINTKSNKSGLHGKPVSKIGTKSLNILGLVLTLILTYPLFYADKISREANLKKDAILAVKAAKTFPESIVRYNRLGVDLYESRLYDLSLEIGRSAVKFNPNAYQTWILILVNPSASILERTIAKENLIRIDPFNRIIANYVIQ